MNLELHPASLPETERAIILRKLLFSSGDAAWRPPDLCIAPRGRPYLYRWYLTPHTRSGVNHMLHLQVADDQDREWLHDHPWNNTSEILLGGYREMMCCDPPTGEIDTYLRRPGDIVFRAAEVCHRLDLAPGIERSISLFTTGPKIRQWGFWVDGVWKHNQEVIRDEPGASFLRDDE